MQEGLTPCAGNLVATAAERADLNAVLARSALLYVNRQPHQRGHTPLRGALKRGYEDPRNLGRRMAVAFCLYSAKQILFSRLNMVRNVIIEENDKIIGKILPDIQSANVAQMYLAIGEYQVSAVRCARKNTRRRTCQFSVGRSVCDS